MLLTSNAAACAPFVADPLSDSTANEHQAFSSTLTAACGESSRTVLHDAPGLGPGTRLLASAPAGAPTRVVRAVSVLLRRGDSFIDRKGYDQMKFFKTKKGLSLLAAVAAVAIAAVAAYAYFTANGSGTGSAKTGKATDVSISQIGAGYDSLIPGDNYIQDQCFSCAQIAELGNDITLANPGAQQLVSVVVAFRNWNGNAITGLPITLTINNTVGGPISAVAHANFPAAITAGSDPSTTRVTFDFSGQGAFVNQEFVYGITFDPSFDSGDAEGLNVALSSSASNLAVGTDTDPGTLWVKTTPGSDGSLGNDFPACTTAPPIGVNVFESITTNCGPAAAGNTGAYGTPAQVAAGNADIPAVQVNVVGGIVTGLEPGGPAQPISFAITNPGSANVSLNSVATTKSTLTGVGSESSEPCTLGMYQINGSPAGPVGTVPPGTTLYQATGTTIQMLDDNHDQDNCEGATVGLTFTGA